MPEIEIPIEVVDSIDSWARIVRAAPASNIPSILRNAARDLFRTRNRLANGNVEEDAVVNAEIVDALQNWAEAAGLDDEVAQGIFADAAIDVEGQTIGEEDEPRPKHKANGHDARVGSTPLIKSSADFVKDFVPPDYLIHGILQRRFLYAFTGKTGSGKTAVVLFIAACIALGRNIGDIEVTPGRVLYLAGENPDDVRMRWIAMAQQMDFDVNAIDVYFVPGRFNISEMRERIVDELQRIGDVVLVIVDTSAAYFQGDEVNSNTQQAEHARMMRTLIGLPGGPGVLVACHPVKNAAADNLLPLGAGAFLNEVDGNLTCVVEGSTVEVHWQGKIRGPDFAPLIFQILTVTHERLVDSKGHKIPTVIAKSLSEGAKEELDQAVEANKLRLLMEINKDGRASTREYASRCGWISARNEPQGFKVHRGLRELTKLGLIKKELKGGYVLTKEGEKQIA